jgi:protein-S-isoprenylcysteine O-methyltransferase Ste14
MENDPTAPVSSSSEKPLAPETREPSEPTLGTEIVSGLLGVGIAVGCVLPPLVHLITGPLGPFIGGFVAGNRAQPGARGRIVIAAMIGTGVAAIIATAASVFVRLVGRSELPSWFPSSGTLLAIVGAIWVYGTVMAAIGTTVGSALSRRRAAERT